MIAIYAISKNEIENVDLFMDSCGDIPVYVLDHSTDGTAEKLRARGAHVDTTPMPDFRFDHAKNFALNLVPDEYIWVLKVDLDERVSPEIHSIQLDPDATLVRHLYCPDAASKRVRHDCFLHKRSEYRWKYPVHECLEFKNSMPSPMKNSFGELIGGGLIRSAEKIQVVDKILLTQHPSKSRKHTWTDRLLKAVCEYPDSTRMRMLCGRDLFFDNRIDDAAEQFMAYLHLDPTSFDSAYVLSMLSKCMNKIGNSKQALSYLEFACDKCSPRRESFIDLAHHYMWIKEYKKCVDAARTALTIEQGMFAPHWDPDCWTFKPHELLMHGYYNLEMFRSAISAGEKALSLAAGDDAKRISNNLEVIRGT